MNARQTQIQDALIDFVSNELLGDRADLELKPEDDLLSSQWVDSLGVMRIVAFLEQRYSVKIPPSDVTIENFVNVKTISAYLETHGNQVEFPADS